MVDPSGADAAALGGGGGRGGGFFRGERVELVDLQSRPELNGRTALVAEDCTPGRDQERIPVQLLTPTGGAFQLPGAMLSIRPDNLRRETLFPADPARETEAVVAAMEEALRDAVGADLVQEVRQRLSCIRCCEPYEGKCKVPHPPHLQVDSGSVFGPEGATLHFFCEACHEGYSLYTPMDDLGNKDKLQHKSGARWCFEGEHLLTDLPENDLRRVSKDIVRLAAGPDLQAQLDELPATHPDVKVLVVQSAGVYDDEHQVSLAVALPNVEEIQLVDVAFSRIALTEELTPKVRKLQMQNVPEECDVDIQLPLLEDLTVHYFRGDGEVMQRMLDAAKNLRTFDSYKLWSNKDIEFASNSLTDIRLHRSDALSTITLWAPRLQHLNVQACYSLDEINILEDHELKSDLPEGFTPTRFQITTLNANLSPELLVELRRNPRVIFGHGGDSNGSEGGGADGFFGGGGYPMDGGSHNPMEALFAHLQGMMAGQAMGEFSGGDFFDDDEESEWETTDGEYCSSAEEHDDDSVEYGDDYYSGGFAANPGVTITEILGENASGGSAPIGGNGVTITEIFDEDD